MVVIGWRRWGNILGMKVDECAACGKIVAHYLLRKTWWFSFFWVPIVLLRFQHGMACSSCGQWTGIPALKLIRGVRAGRLPLNRPRPLFEQMEPDEYGRRPLAGEALDPVTRAHATPSGWYVRLWPFIAAFILIAIIGHSMLFPAPTTAAGRPINTDLQQQYGKAHDCWKAGGQIVGCRLQGGALEGTSAGTPTVCYFNEPDEANIETLMCDR